MAVAFDPTPRLAPVPAELERELDRQPAVRAAFEALVPSRQKEISRYLSSGKTSTTRERNVEKVVDFLLGKGPPGLVVLTGARSEKQRTAKTRATKKRASRKRAPE